MRGIQFIPEGLNLNFIGLRYIAYTISIMLVIGSLALVGARGLNMGIDFTGGTMIEIKTPVEPNIENLRSQLNTLGLGAISIQEFGAPDDLLIRVPEQEGEEGGDDEFNANKHALELVRETLSEAFEGYEIDYRRTEFVGPQVGEELKKQGLYAVLFSLIGIMVYIWMRFEWQFGVAALIALAHDAFITIGLFALTGLEFNLSTVAAILMIAGYSINDTVVVFDRIRENLRKYKKKPFADVFNMAINQTLARTLMTSVTTLLALVALYVFGGEVIRGFVYALIFGIGVGTYSSVFVASPILLLMNINAGRRTPEDEQQAEQVAEQV